MQENLGFGAIPSFQALARQSNSTGICCRCLANHNRIASTKTANTDMKQPLQCDLHPEFNLTMWDTPSASCTCRTNQVPLHRHREPLSARKHGKFRGFRPILYPPKSSKHQLDKPFHRDMMLHIHKMSHDMMFHR